MVLTRKPFPDVGELVVATISQVFDHGAYVVLEEYNRLKAYLPWSEITARHFKDVKEVLREGQRVVAKVIRVNRSRSPPEIDISTKRVSDEERRSKAIMWKRAQKAHNILKLAAERLGMSLEDIYKAFGWRLEDRYREIMMGLEELVIRGEEAASGLNIDPKILETVINEARKHIEIKKVSIEGIAVARSRAPDGVVRVKNLLGEILGTVSSKYSSQGVSASIYTLGAPRYRVALEGTDYKVLEKALSEAVDAASKASRRLEVEFSFERVK